MPVVPCVCVPRERGEETRAFLAERDLLDDSYDITVDDGTIYVPISDPAAVPGDYDVVDRDVPARERQTTPADLLGFDPTYERLGDIYVVDEDDSDRARAAADAIVASDLPGDTVVDRASKVKGDLRVRDWDVLAGDDTETVHREYGCEYLLDIAEVYFSPRLATDRHLVAERVESGEQFFDMFAGVGPFVIPAAKRDAEAVGVDLNPVAVDYLRENARRNGVADRVTAIEGDVRAVVGGSTDDAASDGVAGSPGVRDGGYEGWADRVVMNLPHSADEFLDTAVRLAADECVVHYYDIQHEDDPFGPGERAVRGAAEERGYDVAVENTRVVRSYAPHELNVRLDARLVART
jgi:tRNA (guanine37-N1)-methyltransferase